MTHFHLGPDALARHIESIFHSAYSHSPATIDLLATPLPPPDNKFHSPMKYPLQSPGVSGSIRDNEGECVDTPNQSRPVNCPST